MFLARSASKMYTTEKSLVVSDPSVRDVLSENKIGQVNRNGPCFDIQHLDIRLTSSTLLLPPNPSGCLPGRGQSPK